MKKKKKTQKTNQRININLTFQKNTTQKRTKILNIFVYVFNFQSGHVKIKNK